METGRKTGRTNVVIAPDVGAREDQACYDVAFGVPSKSTPRVRTGITFIECMFFARAITELVVPISFLRENGGR
jgi:hypothetical protein